jgi:adenosine deaminase
LNYDTYLRQARELDLKLAIHAAEVKEQVYETNAILGYLPERLGHFCNVTDNEIRRFRDMGGIVEVCPSSNMVTNSFDSIN